MFQRRMRTVLTAFVVMFLAGALQAQELISVNLWSIGKPSSPSIWVDDPNAPLTLQLDGATSAGAPGFETTVWQNIDLGFPFGKTTAATTINGTGGTSATFEMLNRRNSGPYLWNPSATRDTSDELPANAGNAALLDGKVNSTAFDAANGTGNPFGFQIADYEIRDIPFDNYDVVVYLANQQGQQGDATGTIRINNDVVRPTDLSGGWGAGVVADGGLDDSGGVQFEIPQTAQGYEPDGALIEVVNSGDIGNYIVFSGQSGSTFTFQTWGTGFNHLGAAGFQIREATCTPGDTDGDGDIDTGDLTTSIQNFTGAGGSTTKTCEEGDTDEDGDVDTGDLTFSIQNFTGAQAGNAGVPDLVYDPATGNVTIDADGADVISFSLQSGPFNAADFSELPAGLTDNIASQIGWTSFNLFSGLTGTADLGAILPAGLDLAGLEAALTTASYGLALAGGGGGGRLDLIIPEPASMVLMGLGAVAMVRRRRAA